MAIKKIEEVDAAVLNRRKRLMNALIAVFIGVILIWIVLLILDITEDREIELFNISGIMAPIAMIWIPILNLKKINKELRRREGK